MHEESHQQALALLTACFDKERKEMQVTSQQAKVDIARVQMEAAEAAGKQNTPFQSTGLYLPVKSPSQTSRRQMSQSNRYLLLKCLLYFHLIFFIEILCISLYLTHLKHPQSIDPLNVSQKKCREVLWN